MGEDMGKTSSPIERPLQSSDGTSRTPAEPTCSIKKAGKSGDGRSQQQRLRNRREVAIGFLRWYCDVGSFDHDCDGERDRERQDTTALAGRAVAAAPSVVMAGVLVGVRTGVIVAMMKGRRRIAARRRLH
jgi:hypothetical protein